jgi:hypothetical protein
MPKGILPLFGDLHLHTTESDGILTPEQMVKTVSASGVRWFSITDHDTMSAFQRAKKAAFRYGLQLISGVEITVAWKNHDIHILAYGLNPENTTIIDYFREKHKIRWNRMNKMLDQLGSLGIPLRKEDVTAQIQSVSGLPCRPHLARAMQATGVVTSCHEAFTTFIGDEGPAFIPMQNEQDLKQVIEMVRECGGITIAAHPIKSRLTESFEELQKIGLDGFEVFHPSHTMDEMRTLLNWCREQKLLISGGSDSHDGVNAGHCNLQDKEIEILLNTIATRGGLH